VRTIVAIACLALAAPALCADDAIEVISPHADSVEVTIYRDLFALITETRTVDLPAGGVTLSFDGVVETLLPASAVVADTGRELAERNYDYDELTSNSLFARSIGQHVVLTRTQPGSGKVTQVDATILAANYSGITFSTADGAEALHCSGVPEQVTFSEIPADLHAKPRLSVRLAAGSAGRRTVKLTYLAQGFTWKSDYVARLDARGTKMDLRGWITLRNFTNATLHDAQVNVVAGRLHLLDQSQGGTSTFGDTDDLGDDSSLQQAREQQLEMMQTLADNPNLTAFGGCFATYPEVRMFRRSIVQGAPLSEAMMTMSAEEVIVTGTRKAEAEHEQLGDYHLYRVPWTTDLNARQTKQVSFLAKPEVKVERFYQQSINAYDDAGESNQVPSLMLGFENRKRDGLGEPLPEGVLRLYEPDPAGDVFAGEGNIRDTAVNDPAELRLAGAVDLALQVHREQRWETNPQGERAANLAEAGIRIANAKGQPITIEIRQPSDPYSAGTAQVLQSSVRTYRKKGDYAWKVRVPANTDAALTYRLRVAEPKEADRD
jgi:hypothetical protein